MNAPCGKPDCTARHCAARSKRRKGPCGQHVSGSDKVCHWHGREAPQTRAAASRREAMAEVEAELCGLGVAIEVDPGEALLQMVHQSAGAVAVYGALVAELPMHPVIVLDDQCVEDGQEAQPAGGWLRRRHAAGQLLLSPGLYGPDHLGDARRHILVAMWDAERERLANFARIALAAGVDERRVRLAEHQGQSMAGVVTAVLDALELSPEQREVGRRVATEQLRSLSA